MESHEAMPLQEVMSPTLGPASAIRNAGMTSGPSTTTAVQVPSSLMPHGRTTVDEAAGQVGSLGTTGATYGSVATVEIVDAVGVHGFATSGPEDSGLITVQTGMMEAGVMDPSGDSGYNPPAAIPGGSTGSPEIVLARNGYCHRNSASGLCQSDLCRFTGKSADVVYWWSGRASNIPN